MVKQQEKNTTTYWQDRIDTRKLSLLFISKIWLVILGTVCGAIMGVVLYFAYHLIADEIKYSAVSEFYLDFATDETGEVYQYYNGYTWNDLMSTDLIATETLKGASGVDLTRLEKDTKAEILSDIRVLRVTITDSDEAVCNELQKATEISLETLGSTAKEFNGIDTIKSTKAQRVYSDNRLPQAIELGSIIGLMLTLILLWFAFILDDRIYVPSDTRGLGVPLLGIRSRVSDEKLAEILEKLCMGNKNYVVAQELGENVTPTDIYIIDAGNIQNMTVQSELLDEIGNARGVIIEIPYKQVRKCVVELLLDNLSLRRVVVLGVIIKDADNRFYKNYYQLLPGKRP